MSTASPLEQALEALGIESLFDYQLDCVNDHLEASGDAANVRSCIYYPTGKGKTYTALLAMWALGQHELVIIAPPATQAGWREQAEKLGFTITLMSHAKFRDKGTQLGRTVGIVCDEFHLLGGRKGQGWQKFRRVSKGLQAPVIILSATPSYNAAERVYCVQGVLDPTSVLGGYEKFTLDHCLLEPSFKGMPTVVGFRNFKDAEGYLCSLPQVYHQPDDAVYTIEDSLHVEKMPEPWIKYGFDERKRLLLASGIERRISYVRHQLLNDGDHLRAVHVGWLDGIISKATSNVIVYCDHSTIAHAVADELVLGARYSTRIITGKTSDAHRDSRLQWFTEPHAPLPRVLVCTASIVTGTDGLDKVCDTLVLMQDTQDDSLRRQLVGRILPRGGDTNYSDKRIYRRLVGKP